MIKVYWNHSVREDYIHEANHVLSHSTIKFKSQPFPAAINGPQAHVELIKPLVYIVGSFTAGFLAEAGKQSFRALVPSIKNIFISLFTSIDFSRTSLKPGQRKFVMLNVCVEDLGGPRVTFMFTDEDEAQHIDIMVAKASEFILSPVFQKHIKNFNQYSYQDQAYLESLKLQFDNENYVWKPFNLNQYIHNGKLMINQ